MGKFLNSEWVQEQFEKEGYILLKPYKNSRTKISFICPKGHIYSMTWSSWNKGARCKRCATEKLGIHLRKNFNTIKKSIEKENFILLSKEEDYISNKKSKLKLKCPNNHILFTTWCSWSRGVRCVECHIDSIKLDFNFIKESFAKEKYKIISKEYINAMTNLKYICPKGHKGKMPWATWQQGGRCGVCSGRLKHSINYIKEEFKKENYTLLTTFYKSNKQKLSLSCSKGHIISMKFNSWQQGMRCSICFRSRSQAEKEVVNYLKSIYSGIILENNKKIIWPYELDMVLPELKLAIEYCGVYWHSELNLKDKNYHLKKLNKCHKKGYDVIFILEDEWLQRRKVVESRLKNKIKVRSQNRIFARKCNIQEINYKTSRDFLNIHHLQGADRSKIKLGAFYKEKLVSVMTFGKLSISKGGNPKENTYELNRFCSDYNCQVIGIASKLFKFFIRNFSPDKIVSFGDKRWSRGDLYKHLGFEYGYDTKPNYWYILTNKRFHRFNFRKSVLHKKLDNFDPTLTEVENMKNNKYTRLWDCGSVKWIWKKEE